MKSRFYKIKCTAASDQVLNCQPEIVILNNICHSVISMLILCSTNFISIVSIFRTSRFLMLTGPVPVDFWRKKITPGITIRPTPHFPQPETESLEESETVLLNPNVTPRKIFINTQNLFYFQ